MIKLEHTKATFVAVAPLEDAFGEICVACIQFIPARHLSLAHRVNFDMCDSTCGAHNLVDFQWLLFIGLGPQLRMSLGTVLDENALRHTRVAIHQLEHKHHIDDDTDKQANGRWLQVHLILVLCARLLHDQTNGCIQHQS